MMQKDGRYGWVVVGATFMVGFITDGLTFSFGVLLIELLRAFNKGRASTAVIGSLITGFMHLVGPLAGVLSERYGYRIVVITGSLISAIGFFISVFVDELVYLYITYGFCGGVGFGLMLLPASVCVIQHFEKRRSLANGIAVCGSGVGAFAFNLITGYLLELYGWRGAILIQSGILLNGIVCGLIFVAPESGGESGQQEGDNDQSNMSEIYVYNSNIESKLYDSTQMTETSKSNCDKVIHMNYTHVKEERNNIVHKENTESKNTPGKAPEDINHAVQNSSPNKAVVIHENPPSVSMISGAKYMNHISEFPVSNVDVEHPVSGVMKSEFGVMNKSNIDGKCNTIKDQTLECRSESSSDISFDKETAFRKLCDVVLLRDKKLLTFLLSGFLVNLAFTVPFNLIADEAVENDMTKYEAYWLASSIGIANTISRVIIGWIADRKFINRLVLLMSLLTLVGVSTIISVFLLSFEAKLVYTCVFGFLVGGYIMLCPVVLVDLFGEDVIARSYGLFWFAVGISSFVSTPIAGLLFDRTGSYVISFITAGSEFVLGALVLLFPFLSVRRKMNKTICDS